MLSISIPSIPRPILSPWPLSSLFPLLETALLVVTAGGALFFNGYAHVNSLTSLYANSIRIGLGTLILGTIYLSLSTLSNPLALISIPPTNHRPYASSGIASGLLIGPLVILSLLVVIAKRVVREHASAGAGDDLEMLYYLLHFLVYAILMSLSILTNVSVKSTRPFLTIIPLTAIAYILKSFPIEKGILSIILSQGILYILVTLCNKSFTLGESTLISQAISLFLMDFINLFWGGNTLAQRRDPTTVFFYALVLGMLGIGVVNAPVFMKLVEKSYPVVTVKVSKTKNAKSRINNEDDSNNSSKAYIGYSLAFWVVSITVVVGIIRPWVEGILGVDPFVWVFMFLFAENSRMMLCAYWVVCLLMIFVFRKWLTAVSSSSSTSTPSVTKSKKEEATAKTQKMQLNFRRKFYHGLAVVMFGVGWIVDPPFLHLALSLALSAILLLEYIRIFRIWPLGKDLDIFMKSFIDSKDGYGPLITSHLFLLVGCAATVWLESILNPYNGSRGEGVLDTQSLWTIVSLGRAPFRFLVALSGTIILGVGDSMASVVGYRYGKTLWSAVVSRFVKESSEKTRVSRKSDNSIPLGKKSVEGSLYGMVGCSVLVVMVCVGVLDFNCFLAWGVEKWVTYVGCVVACAILEAVSDQNDNLILPLYMFIIVCLSNLDS